MGRVTSKDNETELKMKQSASSCAFDKQFNVFMPLGFIDN